MTRTAEGESALIAVLAPVTGEYQARRATEFGVTTGVPSGIDDVGEHHRGQNPVRYVPITLSGQKRLNPAGDREEHENHRGPTELDRKHVHRTKTTQHH